MMRRRFSGVVIAATVVAIMGAAPTSAAASQSIGPKQHFVGLVNGKHLHAVIRVVCPGPVRGRAGPPAGGQTVAVKQVPSGGGYTGSVAHQIWAQFGGDTRHVVAFRSYAQPKAIPSGLRLPCSGTGTVTFTTCFGTLPCSATARADQVRVSYQNIAA